MQTRPRPSAMPVRPGERSLSHSIECPSAGSGARFGVLAVLAVLVIAAAIAVAPSAAQANARYAGLVIDAASGEVFYEENASALRYPASLTKIMTLYMVFQALESGELQFDQRLTVSAHANRQPPSRIDIPVGGTIRVEDAIYSLVTKSANNIAVVLAEGIAGSEARFAQRMTDQAHRLGMTRTTFRNASGLPHQEQRTTAHDMALLAQALITHYGSYYHYFSTEAWRYRGATYRNHNRLLSSYAGMDGIKTGYIRASGYNLAASAVRGRLRLIAIVFGGRSSASRNAHIADLLDRSFTSERGRYLIAHGSLPFQPPRPDHPPIWRDGEALTVAVVPIPEGLQDIPSPRPLPAARQTQLAALPHSRQMTLLIDRLENEDMGADGASGASGYWGIQVGAFSDEDDGAEALDAAAASAPDLLGTAVPIVAEVPTDSGVLYRARLLGLDEIAAIQACRRLHASGTSCLTLAPAEIN